MGTAAVRCRDERRHPAVLGGDDNFLFVHVSSIGICTVRLAGLPHRGVYWYASATNERPDQGQSGGNFPRRAMMRNTAQIDKVLADAVAGGKIAGLTAAAADRDGSFYASAFGVRAI